MSSVRKLARVIATAGLLCVIVPVAIIWIYSVLYGVLLTGCVGLFGIAESIVDIIPQESMVDKCIGSMFYRLAISHDNFLAIVNGDGWRHAMTLSVMTNILVGLGMMIGVLIVISLPLLLSYCIVENGVAEGREKM